MDTAFTPWKDLLEIILNLNLRRIGVNIVENNNWSPADDFTDLMLEKAALIENLIKQKEMVKAWIAVVDSIKAWSREKVEDGWVDVKRLTMWFWKMG
ncbi:hypothetical protein FRC02_002735 [Tulasnella sp. 418]|nr:hypothetical protein FRC02_002735 [Tulasnella sp. 418]